MTKRNILITGGTGFIGANLTRRLVALGHRPILLTRKTSTTWRLKDIGQKLRLVESDLLDLNSIKQVFMKIKPDVVYHFASYGVDQRKENSFDDSVKYNLIGTKNLLEASVESKVKSFVNTGSSSEYGFKDSPMKETDPLEPQNLYGVTKGAVSQLCRLYSIGYNLPAVTLRLFSPFGYFEDAKRFVATVCLKAISGEKLELSNPDYVRDFVFIDDVINAYSMFIERNEYYGEVFNIGSGKQMRLGEMVAMVENIVGKKLEVTWKSYQSNQSEPIHWQADLKKSEKLLKWVPKTSINEGIQKTITWFRDNLKLYK